MKDNSLENVFSSYFNNQKDFADFHTLRMEAEASLIPLSKSNVEIYQCSTRLKTIRRGSAHADIYYGRVEYDRFACVL